jgi:cystathionine gamma-synthase/cystathionine gamma-lyase
MEFSTRAIVAGQEPDSLTHSAVPPIYQTSTFARAELGIPQDFEYSRGGNPTRKALETCIASLEEGCYGIAFASGMAAEHAVASILRPGDHVVAPEDMYGGTFRLFAQVLAPMNVECSFVDAANLSELQNALKPNTKMIWLETPTNPLLKIFDIKTIASIAKKQGAILVVDNTFATPYFQQPLKLGAHVVVHSTTKYINGHSDVIGGVVVTSDKLLNDKISFYQKAIGAIPGPFDAWLTIRGVRTLAIRMKQHEENAWAVARFLREHPRVEAVFFPGFEDHPNHHVAKSQMSGFGGLVSFKLKGGYPEVKTFFDKLKIFHLADSLGGVESLVNYSTKMTHETFPDHLKLKIGITDNLIRVSVGIEDKLDLVADLRQALQ